MRSVAWGEAGFFLEVMSESTFPAETTLTHGQGKVPGYQLSDDLARLCLPAEYKDSCRSLAWVNSICFLFLVIGLIGLKPPKIVVRPLTEIAEPVPVELPAPQEQPPVQTEVPPEEIPTDAPVDSPQVATVVAAADPSQVTFAVPVVGAVAVKEARFATPPPPANVAPPKLTRFDPNAAAGGSFPDPSYPGVAQRNRYQGTVTLVFTVDPSGAVTSVSVQKTSGYAVLDNAALEVVKTRWRFPAGPARYYVKDFVFELR